MYREHSVSDIRQIADAMSKASAMLLQALKLMESGSMETVHLQIPPATLYAHSLEKMASDAHFQVRDQMRARDSGADPVFATIRKKNAVDAQKRAAKSTEQNKVSARKKK